LHKPRWPARAGRRGLVLRGRHGERAPRPGAERRDQRRVNASVLVCVEELGG